MELKIIQDIKTEEEARQQAINFQYWASEQNLSYSELNKYQSYFLKLGKKFNLLNEFKENGII